MGDPKLCRAGASLSLVAWSPPSHSGDKFLQGRVTIQVDSVGGNRALDLPGERKPREGIIVFAAAECAWLVLRRERLPQYPHSSRSCGFIWYRLRGHWADRAALLMNVGGAGASFSEIYMPYEESSGF